MNEKEPFGSDAVCRTGLRDKDYGQENEVYNGRKVE